MGRVRREAAVAAPGVSLRAARCARTLDHACTQGLRPTRARAIRHKQPDAFRAPAEGVRRGPERVRRARPEEGPRALRRAGRGDASATSAAARRSTAPRAPLPVVLGSFESGTGRPTVTVYNHLDVQPASKETEPWRTRAVHVHEARATRISAAARPTTRAPRSRRCSAPAPRSTPGVPVNITVPVGARGGGRLAALRATRCKTIGSSGARRTPSSSRTRCGSRARGRRTRRGCAACRRCTLQPGDRRETDQHSGTTGGAARNPVAELAQLVGEIFDARTGRVKVPGFYDDVAKLTPQELADFSGAGLQRVAASRRTTASSRSAPTIRSR